MVDNKLRLAVFKASVGRKWDYKRIASEYRFTQKAVLAVTSDMESQGIPLNDDITEVSTSQAAWVLGVIERRVREFCRNGRLGRLCGGRYVIPVDELLRFTEIPRQPGGAGARQLAERKGKK